MPKRSRVRRKPTGRREGISELRNLRDAFHPVFLCFVLALIRAVHLIDCRFEYEGHVKG